MTVHVSDMQGKRLQGAAIDVEQVSKDFPFGSAIAKTILGNLPYQVRMQSILIEKLAWIFDVGQSMAAEFK